MTRNPQTKPENMPRGDRPAGHGKTISKMAGVERLTPAQIEENRLKIEGMLAYHKPVRTIYNLKDLIYAMHALGGVLITNYTTTAYVQNDSWDVDRALMLPLETNIKAVVSHEFLSQWRGRVVDKEHKRVKCQEFRMVKPMKNHLYMWELVTTYEPLQGAK